MRCLLIVSCIYFLNIASFAQDSVDYGIEKISTSLRQEANVIIRKDHTTFQVLSRSKAHLQVKKIMTVMNEEGSAAVPFYLYYDPHRQITDLNAQVYDTEGKQIERFSAEQFGDYAAVQEANLFEQNRFKVFSYNTDNYPYTIAYSYTVQLDGFYRYPNWSPVRAEGIAVESADFHLMVPDSLGFQYKSYKLAENPEVTTTSEGKLYSWAVRDHKPVVSEPMGPEFYEISPTLQLFPEKFSYDGINGSAESWETFGSWVNRLLDDRDSIADSTRREVLALTENTPEIKQKVRLVRDYVCSQFRYVNLPLGIGSYQPMSASQLEKAGYGDSKAFANYTKSLLKALGIRSHYALLNAGKFATAVEKDRPGAQFSHAVLAIPLVNDTLWLDCSDPHRPIGYLGYFLSDREVLLVTERGGELVRTPDYSAADNLQARHGTVLIKENGQATADITTSFSGLQYAHVSPVLLLNAEQQEEVIYRKTTLPSFSLEAYSYHSRANKRPVLAEKLNLRLEDFCRFSENLISFNPNLMNQMDGLPPYAEERRHTLEVKKAFLDTDTIVYELSENLQIRRLPEDVTIDSTFGKYQMRVRQEGNTILFTRYLKTHKGQFPASAYVDMQEFYEDIVRADQRKVILEQKDEHKEKEELSRTSRLR